MTTATDMMDTAPEMQEARKKAAGSSFYSAMRVLPRAEREAMFAIYAFCRAVDDIADDGIGTRERRHEALESWRKDLKALYQGHASERVSFLRDGVERFHPRLEDFLAVIDGMDMDVAQDICAPTWEMLDLYCDRVASAVGRLSVKVFGMGDDPGFTLAYHLGRSLQLTNILRDLDEDAGINRLYLPREALTEAGIRTFEPRLAISTPLVDKACRIVASRAHEHYRASEAILASHPRGRLAAPRLMIAVYAKILSKMERAGWAPPRERARVGKIELLGLVLRDGLFA
ncbi:MAG TPA: presqualene diphosphate synthase HpnD [Rhizomicrobium sp.]|nr:presqualene diphosphate synthase HpnD [Rhizomicrobium sp.]